VCYSFFRVSIVETKRTTYNTNSCHRQQAVYVYENFMMSKIDGSEEVLALRGNFLLCLKLFHNKIYFEVFYCWCPRSTKGSKRSLHVLQQVT
jgi:hypothetical protein